MGCGTSSKKPIPEDATLYSPSGLKSTAEINPTDFQQPLAIERKISFGKGAEDEEAFVLIPRRMARQYSVDLKDRYIAITFNKSNPTDQDKFPAAVTTALQPSGGKAVLTDTLESSRISNLIPHSILPPIKRDPMQLKYEAIGFDFDFLRMEQGEDVLVSECDSNGMVDALIKDIESI